ncbi:MAG: hypothetical protein FGF48_07730 [Candidatus Brockarchaeota archaeon]|nr:hypothetical protein [Candidatus Brockarchaeota archaeon]
MSGDLAMKLWDMLAEKFKGNEDFYGIKIESKSEHKWHFIIHLHASHKIDIMRQVNGKVKISIGLKHVGHEIEEVLRLYRYNKRFKEASAEEEGRIYQEMRNERDMILEDFKQRKFEKYFDWDVAYPAKKCVWAGEVARRVSEKYGLDVNFEMDKAMFTGTFDSSGMSEGQVTEGVRRVLDAMIEAREMLENEVMMNEFLTEKGIGPSSTPRITNEELRKITIGVAGRLRDLLFERFRGDQNIWEIKLRQLPLLKEKWSIVIDRHPHGFSITAYEDGKIEVAMGPVDHWDGIGDVIWIYKYKRRYERAKTEEERKRIRQEKKEFESRAFDDFMQKDYERYLKDKALDYTARQHIWANEVAKRLSDKYGRSIEFFEDEKPGFAAEFNSTGMGEEQVIEEVMKRIDAMIEVEEMFDNKDMMNEFLISRGIKPVRPRLLRF